ncbi:hypothetical protein CVT24_008803 [Panaeolus cyanescens]|uniref:AB hydrolase-1 domain-containing protein n=1 Tax=Panaeolus cyanescens TaxID=181874 RepID=A0A409VB60_9AGAR|nr:hypothetical protein CVT24_008803 [Panaeolus cyanescens]
MLESTGTSNFVVSGKTFQTWYKVIGDLKSGRRPLVVLHGGPGLTHHYMLPHSELYKKAGIPIILYDQLGNGQSSHYRDCPDNFWTPSLFSDQLESLLRDLEVYDNYDLLGHSWGGFLAAYFASTRKSTGLKRLILANCPASIPLLVEGLNILLDAFGPDFAAMIRKNEAENTLGNPEYQKGMSLFMRSHICAIRPMPKLLHQSFSANKEDNTVNIQMMGPATFYIDGTLRDETTIPHLAGINVPTLVINSDKDEVHDVSVKPFVDLIPQSTWVKMRNSTHVPMFEEPERYFQVLSEFLS